MNYLNSTDDNGQVNCLPFDSEAAQADPANPQQRVINIKGIVIRTDYVSKSHS